MELYSDTDSDEDAESDHFSSAEEEVQAGGDHHLYDYAEYQDEEEEYWMGGILEEDDEIEV